MSKMVRKMIGWMSVATMCAGAVGMPLQAADAHYATNPSGYGKNAKITIDGSFDDWSGDMLIAQGVANDDARTFRGSHEGPVYDTYSLYGAWDDDNLYLMWQFVNVTDVVDPAQGYPISDNGKPWNGDIPQIIALSIDPSRGGSGECINGKVIDDNIWGIKVNYETPVDTLLYFSSKPGVGKPALFKVNDEGYFDYSTAVDFKTAGISFKYGDGLHHSISSVMGINANGYAGYKPSDLEGGTSFSWANMLSLGHSKSQDTMYEMVIPLKSLGITKQYLEDNGIGVMHISTFGQSGITSIPYDSAMLDKATEPYGPDASTSEEKEDQDIVTTSLADVGTKRSGSVIHKDLPTVSISPEEKDFTGSTLTLTLNVKKANSATYKIDNGSEIPYVDGQQVTVSDIEKGQSVKVTLKATNADGMTTKEYVYKNTETAVTPGTPGESEEARTIYIRKPSNWGSNINLYAYDERNGQVKTLAAWPGVAMESAGYGYYKYTLPTSWDYANIIFNDGNNQVPQATGFVYDNCSIPMSYENGTWGEYLGMYIPAGRQITFNNNSTNWSNVYAYIYDESDGYVKEISKWPGVAMDNVGNNTYEYIFNGDWTNAKVIFNNGSGAQIPGSGQTGYSLTGNLTYSNGVCSSN